MLAVVVALGVLCFMLGWTGAVFVIVVGILAAAIVAIVQSDKQKERRQKAQALLQQEVDRQIGLAKNRITDHIEELSLRERQLTFDAGYGQTDKTKWEAEKARFINNVIKTAVGANLVLTEQSVSEVIDAAVKQYREKSPQTAAAQDNRQFFATMSGVDYERLCAQMLEDCGWSARTTAASGDQGADILAERGRWKLVVQCKRYSHGVGNKAVQEVAAARTFYGMDRAAVISNARFTASARQLAKSLDVLLLHHEEIPKLHHLLAS